jgi:hypothetical protein
MPQCVGAAQVSIPDFVTMMESQLLTDFLNIPSSARDSSTMILNCESASKTLENVRIDAGMDL